MTLSSERWLYRTWNPTKNYWTPWNSPRRSRVCVPASRIFRKGGRSSLRMYSTNCSSAKSAAARNLEQIKGTNNSSLGIHYDGIVFLVVFFVLLFESEVGRPTDRLFRPGFWVRLRHNHDPPPKEGSKRMNRLAQKPQIRLYDLLHVKGLRGRSSRTAQGTTHPSRDRRSPQWSILLLICLPDRFASSGSLNPSERFRSPAWRCSPWYG